MPVKTIANPLENAVEIQSAKEVSGEKPYIQDYNDDAGLTWTRLVGTGDISKNKNSGTLNIKRGNENNNFSIYRRTISKFTRWRSGNKIYD